MLLRVTIRFLDRSKWFKGYLENLLLKHCCCKQVQVSNALDSLLENLSKYFHDHDLHYRASNK